MRQYRFLEITTQYEQYLRNFYRVHNQIDDLSYDELFELIVNDCFAESNFIQRQLNKMGIESKVVFCNNRNLQRKWKKANEEMSYFEIVLSQIRDFSPDVILMSDMCWLSPKETMIIKEEVLDKKIKLLGFHFTKLHDTFRRNALLYDQIYTGSSFFVKTMRDLGLPACLLRHAFEPEILDRMKDHEKKNEVCFAASIFAGADIHNNRLDMLDKMKASHIPYSFYGDIYGTLQEMLSTENGKKYIGIIAQISRDLHAGVFGLEYYSVLDQYKICLNLHTSVAGDGAGNMRMFEATGMGTCLLTDYRSENAEMFEADREMVVYDSMEDMIEKARWLLDHPAKAKEIALAGQKRTLTEYTYKNKAECLNEHIQTLLK